MIRLDSYDGYDAAADDRIDPGDIEMNQKNLAEQFAEMHIKGEPLIIFNVWDAGTAKAVEEIGAKAVATGSWAVAEANGFDDGEKIPFELVIANLQRITASVKLPVSLDLEGGYSREPEALRENVTKVIEAGAVGINFEDRIVSGEDLYDVEEQCERILAVRAAADDLSIPLFINVRTDIFLRLDTVAHTEARLNEAIARASAYADAGVSGFFAPALIDPEFIGRLCDASPIPVNILIWPGLPTERKLAELGVSRVSYGSRSYRLTIEAFKKAARAALIDLKAASVPGTERL